ncbi:hypothetical protein [Halorubrum gandharaense]
MSPRDREKAEIKLGDTGDPDNINELVETVRDRLRSTGVLVTHTTSRPSKPFLGTEPDVIF